MTHTMHRFLPTSWKFQSENGDIAFSIAHSKEDKIKEIVPRERISCHVATEEGEIDCIETGKCSTFYTNHLFCPFDLSTSLFIPMTQTLWNLTTATATSVRRRYGLRSR